MEHVPKKISVEKEPVERFFNFRPLLFSAVFLCLGVVFAYFRAIKGVSPLVAFVPLGILLLSFFFVKNKKKALAAVLALAFAFSLGSLTFSLQLHSYQRVDAVDGYYTVTGRITEKGLGGERCQVKIEGVALNGEAVNGALTATLPSSIANSLQLSDRVEFFSYIQVNTQALNSYGFKAEAISENIRFSAGAVSDIRVTGHEEDLLLKVREALTQTIRKGMDETPAAVTLAVLLGDVSAMEEGLLENVRKGGIAHIFAVSGLHIGTLFGVLVALMKKTKLQRLPKVFRWMMVLFVLLFYGGICGYSASVVRATITCLALYLYKLMGEKSDSLETISFAALCVLVMKPTQLFSVGFQLSFAACYGIAILSRPISETTHCLVERVETFVLQKLLKRQPAPVVDIFQSDTPPPSMYTLAKRAVIGFLSVSLSAQAFTVPVLLTSFGYVSNAGLILNCLFVPILSLAFCPLLSFTFAAYIISAWETVVLFVPNTLLSAVLLFFQRIDFSSAITQGIECSAGAIVAYYTALLCCSDKYNERKTQKLLLIGVCFVALVVCLVSVNL